MLKGEIGTIERNKTSDKTDFKCILEIEEKESQ